MNGVSGNEFVEISIHSVDVYQNLVQLACSEHFGFHLVYWHFVLVN